MDLVILEVSSDFPPASPQGWMTSSVLGRELGLYLFSKAHV